MWPADLPPCFHLVLSPDASRQPEGRRSPRGRVVLLHGWHQSHRSWLRTATVLRDKLGLEVLLLDWYNHGESPTLPDRRLHCAELLCRQLRALILHLGWQAERLALGGASLGGAVALHYFSRWPESVAKLVLIATAGLDERSWVPSVPLANVANALMGTPPTHGRGQEEQEEEEEQESASLCCEEAAGVAREGPSEVVEFPSLADAPRAPWSTFLLARFSFPTTAPSYRVPGDIIKRLREARVGIAVYTGGLDILHTSQRKLWQTIPGAVIKHIPLMDHVVLCSSISRLHLWKRPELWLDVPPARL